MHTHLKANIIIFLIRYYNTLTCDNLLWYQIFQKSAIHEGFDIAGQQIHFRFGTYDHPNSATASHCLEILNSALNRAWRTNKFHYSSLLMAKRFFTKCYPSLPKPLWWWVVPPTLVHCFILLGFWILQLHNGLHEIFYCICSFALRNFPASYWLMPKPFWLDEELL